MDGKHPPHPVLIGLILGGWVTNVLKNGDEK